MPGSPCWKAATVASPRSCRWPRRRCIRICARAAPSSKSMASSSRPRRRASVAPSRTVPVRRRQRPASGRSSWQPGTRPANTDLRRKHMPGLHYEEFSVGQAFDHEWTRTVTEMDNTLFSTLTLNVQPLHLDEHFSAGTEFGQRIVNSLFTPGLQIGMTVNDSTLRKIGKADWRERGGTVV